MTLFHFCDITFPSADSRALSICRKVSRLKREAHSTQTVTWTAVILWTGWRAELYNPAVCGQLFALLPYLPCALFSVQEFCSLIRCPLLKWGACVLVIGLLVDFFFFDSSYIASQLFKSFVLQERLPGDVIFIYVLKLDVIKDGSMLSPPPTCPRVTLIAFLFSHLWDFAFI